MPGEPFCFNAILKHNDLQRVQLYIAIALIDVIGGKLLHIKSPQPQASGRLQQMLHLVNKVEQSSWNGMKWKTHQSWHCFANHLAKLPLLNRFSMPFKNSDIDNRPSDLMMIHRLPGAKNTRYGTEKTSDCSLMNSAIARSSDSGRGATSACSATSA